MKRDDINLKIISLFTLIAFVSTPVTWAEPANASPSNINQSLNLQSEKLIIPAALGTIQEQKLGAPEKPQIIFIQDAHAVIDAQNNISALMEYFQARYGINLIALEGGQGKIDTTLFNAFPERDITKKVMQVYLDRAEINGAVLASALNSNDVGYYGIEDWPLYEMNYVAYLRAMKRKDEILKELDRLRQKLDAERRTVYSPEMSLFHEKVQAFRDEKGKLMDLLDYIRNSGEGAWQKDIRAGKYPHLKVLLESVGNDAKFASAEASVQVNDLAKKIKKQFGRQLNKNEVMGFNGAFQDFATGRSEAASYLKYLITFAEKKGEGLKLTPLLQHLLGYADTLATIKGTKLFEELEDVLNDIEEGLITKKEERSISERYKKILILKNLAALELTREELEIFSKSPEVYQELILNRGLLTPAIDFYRFALRRDSALHENLEKLMREHHAKTAVVLAGGFHSEGFAASMEERGYSYAVITPRIKSLAGHERYEPVMNGELSYKDYLTTTVYDAFARHATLKLVSEMNAPDFRKILKLWRDETIRRLAAQGRVASAGRYTRYLDLLIRLYAEKFGPESLDLTSKDNMIKAVQEKLAEYRDDSLARLWKNFETKLSGFADGVQSLIDTKGVSDKKIAALIREEGLKPSALAASLGEVIPDLSPGILEQVVLGKLDFSALDAMRIPVSMSDIRDVLTEKRSLSGASDLAVLPEIGRGVEVLSRIAQEGLPSSPVSRQIAVKVVDEVIGAIRPKALEQATATVDSEIAAALNEKLDAAAKAASLGEGQAEPMNPEWRSARITALLDSMRLEEFITDENIRELSDPVTETEARERMLAVMLEKVDPVIEEIRNIYNEVLSASRKRAERYPDQARRDQGNLTGILTRNEVNEKFLQPFIRKMEILLEAKGVRHPFFDEILQSMRRTDSVTFISYTMGSSDLPLNLSLADPQSLNDQILAPLTYSRWDDSGIMLDHEAVFGAQAVDHLYEQMLIWSTASVSSKFSVAHRLIPAVAQVNERGRLEMARYLLLSWSHNLFSEYGNPDHETVYFAKTFSDANLARLAELEKLGNPAYPPGFSALLKGIRDNHQQYWFHPQFEADSQKPVVDKLQSARADMRKVLFDYLDTPGFQALAVATLHRLADNPYALDKREILPRALAIFNSSGVDPAVKTATAVYLAKSMTKSLSPDIPKFLVEHFEEFPDFVKDEISRHAGEAYRNLVYQKRFQIDIDFAQKIAAVFNHQASRTAKLSALDILDTAGFMQMLEEKVYFRFNGEYVDWAFKFAKSPLFMRLITSFHEADYRSENKHLPRWGALLSRAHAEDLEGIVKTISGYARRQGYGLSWGYFEGAQGELETTAISGMPMDKILESIPADSAAIQPGSEFAVVIDARLGLLPGGPSDYAAFAAELARFRDVMGDSAEGFLHSSFESLVGKLKARDPQLTIKGVADYLAAVNHIEQAIHIPQPFETETDHLTEDDIMIITEYLFMHAHTPANLTKLFDDFFNSQAAGPKRKLDYHFFVTFMKNLVNENETLVTPEADIFLKLFASKKLYGYYLINKVVWRNANMLDASGDNESARLFQQSLRLLNRVRTDYLGRTWKLYGAAADKQAASNNDLEKKVELEDGHREELGRVLAKEFVGFLGLMIDLTALGEAAPGTEQGPLQKLKSGVMNAVDRVASAGEKSAARRYAEFYKAQRNFRDAFAKEKAGVLFDLFRAVIPLSGDQIQTDLADLKEYTKRAPKNQIGESTIDSMVQFVQSNRSRPEVIAEAYRIMTAEARGEFADYRYRSPDYARMFAEWETSRKPEQETDELKRAREEEISRIQSNWQANQYYTVADEAGKKLHLGFTDNFATLLNLGNPDYFGSCQATYKADYNRGVAGMLANGWNKALVIYDDNGRFLARRIVRLRLTDKGEFVLLSEQTYGFNTHENLFDDMMAKLAHDLGVRYEAGDVKNAEPVTLRLWKGNSEWEYSDMYGKQFVGENAGLIRMKEGEEFKPYLNISLSLSTVGVMGQVTGLQYTAESEGDFKLIANREQTGTLIAVDFAAMASSSFTGSATAASLGKSRTAEKKELKRIHPEESAAELTIADLQAKAREARKSWASWLRFGALTAAGLIIAPGAMKLLLVMFLVYMPLHELAHYVVARYYFYKNYPADAQDENIKKDAPVFEPIVRWAFGIFPHPAVIYEEKRYTSFQNALIIIMAPISELLLGFAAYAVISGIGTEGSLLDLVQVVAVAGLAAVPIRLFAEFFSKHSDVRKFIANLRNPYGLPDTGTPDIETRFVGKTVPLDMKHPEPGMGEPFTDKDKFPQQPSGQSLGVEPEHLEIMELLPGSNTWRLRDIRPGGYDRYLKLDHMGREEELGFRYARLLGANAPRWQRFKVSDLDQLIFGDQAQDRWGEEWGETVREIKEHAAQSGEDNVVLAQDIAAMTESDLAVPDSSGFEEMLVFLAFTDARDIGWNANLERREIGGERRFLLFDMTSAAFLGAPMDQAFTYNDEMIGRMHEELDAARLKAVIDRIKAMSPDDFVRQALEAGYPAQAIHRGGFAERQQNLGLIVANALMSSVDSVLIATGLPLFADSFINYQHINYLLDTPEYAADFWKDIMKDLFDANAPLFTALLDKSDDEIFAFARDKNPYFNLTLDAVAKTVQVMLDSIPAYGENALPGFKKTELAGFEQAYELGKEILRKVNHARDVVGRLRLEESRLYQKIQQTAEYIGRGSAVGASLGESVPFNEMIAALRNHIGRGDSDFFQVMRARILNGEAPIRAGDPIGRVSSVDTLLPSFRDKHFPDPHEAVREIVTNAYDAMKGIPDPANRPVDVKLGRAGESGTLEVTDRGPGMNLNTILTKFLPPFQGEKRSVRLDNLKEFFERTDLTAAQKLEELGRALPSDLSEFSAFERAVFEDLKRKLDAHEIEKQAGTLDESRAPAVLGSLRETVYSTGQFGIGFYSLLYFVREEGDKVEVDTVFGEGPGRESYRITYSIEGGKLAIRIDPVKDASRTPGTIVRLQSKSFDNDAAQRVIRDFLSFDSNGKINVQMDEDAPYTVNEEVFNSQAFESFQDGVEGVETYISRDVRRSKGDPKTRVYINVHGVTIFSQEIEGFGMPQKVVLNFPATIKLPISRNRLLADALFISKAQAMIALMEKNRRVDLISAFYPLVANLQYKNAQDENILKTRMEQAVTQLRAWNESFVPNTEEFTKLAPHDRLFLVEPALLNGNMIAYSGALTPFQHDGQPVMLGKKPVYLADFTDDTKYAASDHAILINRAHEPQIDVDRALFNVLLSLSRQPVFEYYQPPGDTQTAVVSQPEAEPSGQAEAAIPVEELERRAAQVLVRAMEKSEAVYLFLFPIIQYGRGQPPDEFGLLLNGESDLVLVAERFLALNPGEHFPPSLDEYSQKEWFYQLSHQIRIKSEDDPGFWNVLLKNPKARDLMAAVESDKYTVFRLFSAMKNKIPDDKRQVPGFIDTALERLLDIKDLIKDFKYRIDEQVFLAAVYLDEGHLRGHREGLARLGLFLDEPGLDRNVGGVVADYFERDIAALRGYYLPRSLHKLIRNDFVFITKYEEIVAYALTHIRPWEDKRPEDILRYYGTANFLTGIASLPLDEAKHVIDIVFKENPDQSMYTTESMFRSARAFLYYFSKEEESKPPGEASEFADWQQTYETLKGSQLGMVLADSILESDIPMNGKKAYVKQIVKMVRENAMPHYSSSYYYFLRDYFDFSLLESMPENEMGIFLNFLLTFNPAYEDSFIKRKHEAAQPGTEPALSDYIRHRNEITGKLLNIFKIVRSGGSQKYKDFMEALSQSAYYLDKREVSQFSAEIAPFVSYLLSSSDVSDVADEIAVDPSKARNFRLLDLYDSWTALPDVRTEGAESVSARIDQAAALRVNTESGREARREFLAADFRSVAKQNVDLNVAARELVQNVIDETPPGFQGKVEVRTSRKEAGGRRLTVLDVKDEIGMDIERIYNKLLMPYSTTKRDPAKPSLGEQGQGFFTLLSNSEYVTIRSVRDGRGRKLRITPVRRYGEVIDYTVEDEEIDPADLADEANGTHIQAFINLGVPELEAEMITSAVGKYAGLVDPSRVLILVNGTTVNDNRDRLLAQRESPRGTVEFFSTPGISNVALGGLQFKAMDETFWALIPQALRAPLSGAGFSVNLPGFNPADPLQTIRRIQGGSEIAEREVVYKDIEAAVATGALESAVAMFSRGDIRNLDMIGYDYFGDSKQEIEIEPSIVEDARSLKENPGSVDRDRIYEQYLKDTPEGKNRLGHLLLAYPLDFLPLFEGRNLSLMEFFNLYRKDPGIFPDVTQLPEPLQNALKLVSDRVQREDGQRQSLESMGLPGDLLGKHFDVPVEMRSRAGAYDVFLSISDYLAQIAIRKVLDLVTAEDVGEGFLQRINELGENPPMANFYAAPDGLSMAHALQETSLYAWNILDAESLIKKLSEYLKDGPERQGEFLAEFAEAMTKILTHELTHLMEGTGEGTHDKLFHDRQKFLVSALIGAKDEIAMYLADLPARYREQTGFVPVQEFLDMMVSAGKARIVGGKVIERDEPQRPAVEGASLGQNPLTVLTGFETDGALARHLEELIREGKITNADTLRRYMRELAGIKMKEFRTILESHSVGIVEKLARAEDFFDALFDLEQDLEGLAASVAGVGIQITAAELASSLRAAVFESGAEESVKYAEQAEKTVSDGQLRLYEERMAAAQGKLVRNAAESGRKFSLAIQHAGRDMQLELDSIKAYRQMIKLLIILHDKSQSLNRSDLSAIDVTTLPLLLETGTDSRKEKAIRQAMRQMDSVQVPPLFVFTQKLGLTPDLSKMLLSILSQIDQVPDRLKKQAIDAVLLVIFSLAMAGENERNQVLGGSKPAFEKLLADYNVSFLQDAFHMDSGGGMSLSIASFISSIIEAAQEQALTEKAA